MTQGIDVQRLRRRLLKGLLAPWLHWEALSDPAPGFSIVLGTPWSLRDLLSVNLRFVAATDTTQLHRLYVVFDRIRQPGADAFVEGLRSRFPSLPLDFRFHPPVAGRIVQRIHQSKFYAATNWTLGLGACETRYAVLHDFDLYPLAPHYFEAIVDTMAREGYHVAGSEYSHFDGLVDEDRLMGSWALGIDVPWLRSRYRPIDCYHAVTEVRGRRVDLDPFGYIQSCTPERGLARGLDPTSFVHILNLCSTYLRFQKGEAVNLAWRLQSLWYLQSLGDQPDQLARMTGRMRDATSAVLDLEGRAADFSSTHVTCANVLDREVLPMEQSLFGACRPEVREYLRAFRSFLARFGDTSGELGQEAVARLEESGAPA